jgi:hypothetical protein
MQRYTGSVHTILKLEEQFNLYKCELTNVEQGWKWDFSQVDIICLAVELLYG